MKIKKYKTGSIEIINYKPINSIKQADKFIKELERLI